jgi:hypothetical protein
MNPAIANEHLRQLAALASRREPLDKAAVALLVSADACVRETTRKYEEIGRDIARGSRLARPRRPL